MISITNGINRMSVTRGAYREIFAPQGWIIVDDEISDQTGVGLQIPNKPAEIENYEEIDGSSEDVDDIENDVDETDYEEDEEIETEDEEIEELEEKPLSELSFDELQRLAKYKGIDISGLRSKKELRQAIKSL